MPPRIGRDAHRESVEQTEQFTLNAFTADVPRTSECATCTQLLEPVEEENPVLRERLRRADRIDDAGHEVLDVFADVARLREPTHIRVIRRKARDRAHRAAERGLSDASRTHDENPRNRYAGVVVMCAVVVLSDG